ncbi:MAG: flagellin [Christensenellales bacterium]|jgi:flagellin
MRINNNIMALNTHRQYTINTQNVATSTEKLSSGYRINRAGDDAAGLAISEKMRAQIRGLTMASKNSQDAISLVQTAEGALQETHSILQRMRELATQSASDTNETVDRAALNEEFTALISELDDIAQKTAFNDKLLLDGSFGSTATVDATSEIKIGTLGITNIEFEGFAVGAHTIDFTQVGAGDPYSAELDAPGSTVVVSNAAGAQTLRLDFGGGQKITIVMSDAAAADQFAAAATNQLAFTVAGDSSYIQTGANAGDKLAITISGMSAADLSVDTQTIGDQPTAEAAITAVNAAINAVSTQRAKLGAIQNRLAHKINNLDTSAENLQAAESRIRDIDMAKEMTNFTKNQILSQASTAMLAQANAAPQSVLKLLQ